jgi:hypothetical protein
MSSERKERSSIRTDESGAPAADVDARTGQPVEDAEKNLSRHTTKDSSPAIEEQGRTTVPKDED